MNAERNADVLLSVNKEVGQGRTGSTQRCQGGGEQDGRTSALRADLPERGDRAPQGSKPIAGVGEGLLGSLQASD